MHYKGEKVGRKRVDFIIDEVLVEIKAKAQLEPVDFADIVLLEGVWLQGSLAPQLWCAETADQALSVLI